jgi:hypothetical protein
MIHHQSITLAKGKKFDQIAREVLVAYKSDINNVTILTWESS